MPRKSYLPDENLGIETAKPMNVLGLFAGIGGVELGLTRAGHRCKGLCEIDPGALQVLKKQFPHSEIYKDVKSIDKISPEVNCITGGFPCQDLSQAGRGAGIIDGKESSLVSEIFRILTNNAVDNVILENVPFMLSLQGGKAMEVLVNSFEQLDYKWAYRTVDTLCFGLPQRRQRVIFVASKTINPKTILLGDVSDFENKDKNAVGKYACGFYWTEGLKGLGWAVDAVPTIKGGSTIGIPSPPAICLTDGKVGTPDIRDAERMQGFPENWTLPSTEVQKESFRWKLVGNAVTVDVFEWIGRRFICSNEIGNQTSGKPIKQGKKWPSAGWNIGEGRFGAEFSLYPANIQRDELQRWLKYPLKPLSIRATSGFLSRVEKSKLNFPPNFKDVVRNHLGVMQKNLLE